MMFLMDTISFNIVYFTEMGINVLLFIINILVSIFLCAEWFKQKSIFKSSYFYLLNSFFILNIPYTFFWVYGRTIFYALDDPLLPEVLVVQWYVGGCKGIWEAVMGLSRCTALAFPSLHKTLWDGNRWLYSFALIYLFPFVSQYFVFTRPACKFLSSSAPGCLQFREETVFFTSVMNLSLCSLSLILVLIGIIMAPKKVHKNKKFKMERRLVLQTFLSAFFQTLLYAELFIHLFSETYEYRITSYLFWMIQYYIPMILTFFVTPNIRNEFINFYLTLFRSKTLTPIITITPMHSRII